jgi:hypothetical protein
MLVALAVFGLLMVIVQQGLSFAATTRERMLARSDGVQQLVLVRDLIRRQLERAQLVGWGPGQDKQLAFEAGPDVLRFANLAPPYQAGPAWQLWEFSLAPIGDDQRQLLLRRATLDYEQPGFATLQRAEPRLLATIPAPVQFTYFGAMGDERGPGWVEIWRSTGQLPQVVRLADPTASGAWPDLVIGLRIDAGGRCAAEGGGEDLGCAN